MLTIYSPVQRTHRPAYVVKQGERSASFDVPERVDSILSAINGQELGPVIAPDDAGLDDPRRSRHGYDRVPDDRTRAADRLRAAECRSRSLDARVSNLLSAFRATAASRLLRRTKGVLLQGVRHCTRRRRGHSGEHGKGSNARLYLGPVSGAWQRPQQVEASNALGMPYRQVPQSSELNPRLTTN